MPHARHVPITRHSRPRHTPLTSHLPCATHFASPVVAGSPLFWVPYVLPLDKNIVFHKACAKYFIFASVFGHASAHYFNYAAAPYYNGALGDAIYLASPTDMAWGPAVPGAGGAGPGTPAPGFTGEVLMLAMIGLRAFSPLRAPSRSFRGARAFPALRCS